MSTRRVSTIYVPSDDSLPVSQLYLQGSESNVGDQLPSLLGPLLNNNVEVTVLYRGLQLNSSSLRLPNFSVFAYSDELAKITSSSSETLPPHNIRATTLAMSCGLHAVKFYGDVYLGMFGPRSQEGLPSGNLDAQVSDFVFSPDLRSLECKEWQGEAAAVNYSFSSVLEALSSAMARSTLESEDSDSSSCSGDDSDEEVISPPPPPLVPSTTPASSSSPDSPSTAIRTFCLSCRRPSSNLCPTCLGAYFCSPRCVEVGWSHNCLCPFWSRYCSRRSELSSFPDFTWSHHLNDNPESYVTDAPYKRYLMEIGLYGKGFWRTEFEGWAKGLSGSASSVASGVRVNIPSGFHLQPDFCPSLDPPLSSWLIDSLGLPELDTWGLYYQYARINPSSPAALLLSYPLTAFISVKFFARPQLYAASLLRRRLRLHFVGVEKELNFLDLFAVLGPLFSGAVIGLDVTFVVRKDALPPLCLPSAGLEPLSPLVSAQVVAGTYNLDISPDFDIPGGPPDVVIGLNAGFYAYPSWRSVVEYLRERPDVAGAFSDYNEYSGLNCASLGGSEGRNSLRVNPFRQPAALPVLSMNLPQYANGFLYAFNNQDIDE